MAASKKYRVQYTRDESGWWQASVPAVRGCHTQGRTIDEARRRIRGALALFVDDARRATLTDDVRMPKRVAAAVLQYRTARERVEREQQQASATARRAVKALAGGRLNLSRRDTGAVLGISAQRVQQLLDTADDRRR
ncbi:MAG TPA: type II toxin-antitoxin system HicB family antitoxin [Vicinamibacterales bacterium]|nr:type II toxin-antitoxin system HicB family antitoxin [Vicinamibacterales bacterium]